MDCWTAFTAIQCASGTRNHSSTRRFEEAGSLRLDSGLPLDLEIALGGVSAKIQPHGLLQPGRRCVETSGEVIEQVPDRPQNHCRAFFTARQATPKHCRRDLSATSPKIA